MTAAAFHAGEQALQARYGIAERMAQSGRKSIRDFMPDQHRDFFAELPFLVVGSLDRRGRPWASILAGRPGFLSSPDPRTLRAAARPDVADPLAANLRPGAKLGLLGIQPETRRRNRMNGTVVEAGARGFAAAVAQSFGNCPQYIQARAPRLLDAARPAVTVRAEAALLSPRAAALARRADTFFIATASADPGADDRAQGVDVSHRGGKPGFARVTQDSGRTVLTVPDFRGNFMFNTLGNIAVNPAAGLVFVDFATGDVLQLVGTAEAIFEGPELRGFAGAERLLRFAVAEGLWREAALPLRWSAAEPAPQLAATGAWN
ncbi:MAG: pyridoxamine 5'-phosphate oxidase family protein [Alphaproteobacteria bacterium]|nr:pyridoxamine 5'-phosphate oxidase family protein [Alphaproteobacteria bacterium]